MRAKILVWRRTRGYNTSNRLQELYKSDHVCGCFWAFTHWAHPVWRRQIKPTTSMQISYSTADCHCALFTSLHRSTRKDPERLHYLRAEHHSVT
jgi:hypothetical protein